MNAKLAITMIILLVFGIAGASIKDPRKNVKLKPELSQEQVAKQQALQKTQGEIGIAPRRTDETGMPITREDSEAGSIVALAKTAGDEPSPSSAALLKDADEEIAAKASAPKRTAMSLLWWLLGAGVIVAAAVFGLNKYAPVPANARL